MGAGHYRENEQLYSDALDGAFGKEKMDEWRRRSRRHLAWQWVGIITALIIAFQWGDSCS